MAHRRNHADWNTVISVHEGGFAPSLRLMETFGPVRKTEFFNTLMRASGNFPPERSCGSATSPDTLDKNCGIIFVGILVNALKVL